MHASVLALPVTHPDHRDTPLWLVVCRSKGRTPWYLLTAEPITTDEDAWRVVFAYMRRWQSELAWRFDQSELAFQSPRLWRGPERMKLLAMATLAYAFLLQLLAPCYEPLRLWLLRSFCHRTGWHLRLSSRSRCTACAPHSAAWGNGIHLALLPWAGHAGSSVW